MGRSQGLSVFCCTETDDFLRMVSCWFLDVPANQKCLRLDLESGEQGVIGKARAKVERQQRETVGAVDFRDHQTKHLRIVSHAHPCCCPRPTRVQCKTPATFLQQARLFPMGSLKLGGTTLTPSTSTPPSPPGLGTAQDRSELPMRIFQVRLIR